MDKTGLPKVLYENGSILQKMLLDFMDKDVHKIVVNEEKVADKVEQERTILTEQAENEGLDANKLPMIVNGRLNKFYEEVCLLEQGFIKENKMKVSKFVEDKKMKGVTLVDNRVFSSGTFAAYYAKKVLGTPLIGQNLAQENIRFGQSSGTVCLAENLLIRYTEKFFDFSDVFKESGAIKPDIEVPIHIEDLENKKDLTLEVAKEYLKSNFMKKTIQCNTK